MGQIGPIQLFLAENAHFFWKIEVKNQVCVKNSTKIVKESDFFMILCLRSTF